jgi:hypothetical protein
MFLMIFDDLFIRELSRRRIPGEDDDYFGEEEEEEEEGPQRAGQKRKQLPWRQNSAVAKLF